jgi:hypothetical protein
MQSDDRVDIRTVCNSWVGEDLKKWSSTASSLIIDCLPKRFVGLTIAVVKMPMRQAHRDLPCDTMWWLQFVARIRNLLASYQVVYIDAIMWSQRAPFFEDSLHLFLQDTEQFGQRADRLLGPDSANLSAASAEGRTHL